MAGEKTRRAETVKEEAEREREDFQSWSCSHYPQTIHTPYGIYWRRCTRLMMSGKTLSTCATSSAEDFRPSEKRTSELAIPFSTPSAETTCEGSSDPAEHAEPLE